HEAKAQEAVRVVRRQGPTFGEVAKRVVGVGRSGNVRARRRGRAKQLSQTTIADYRRILFGGGEKEHPGSEVEAVATYLAVVRHVYAFARRANRRFVPVDPTRELMMPANVGQPRERVATREKAAKLVEAIPRIQTTAALAWEAVLTIRRSRDSAVLLARRFGVSDSLIVKVRRGKRYKTPDSSRSSQASDRAGWALAFYTGMRRGEIGRARWTHVFWEADEIMVDASKSDAGEGRRIPMVGPLKKILREEWVRQGQPKDEPIVTRSVHSGKWQSRADEVWESAGLERITLHEARHTYASFLMAAGYTLKQIQEIPGPCRPSHYRALHQKPARSAGDD
ncbi:MAG: tyrosine-type recombinase/integrase, partial [Solirubrobacteraceae bacterium]